jgi:peptidoglycan/xylan/chitin deacetylase (PgdA/CDA1 family)
VGYARRVPTNVLISIDTELRAGPYLAGAGWQENFRLSFDPAGLGVPYQLKMLRRHGLKACFFVDPMPARLYGLEPVRRMVETILEGGQEVQLHFHSFWADAARGTEPRFNLTQFSAEEQHEMISEAADLLVRAGAPRPVAFRAGSFAANADTMAALQRLGIAYDSSHNGAAHPWPSALPLDPELIDPANICGVTEIPVTHIRSGGGELRPLQVCALSADEMQAALRHASTNDHPIATTAGPMGSSAAASTGSARSSRRIARRCRPSPFPSLPELPLPRGRFLCLPIGRARRPASFSRPGERRATTVRSRPPPRPRRRSL